MIYISNYMTLKSKSILVSQNKSDYHWNISCILLSLSLTHTYIVLI